MHNLKPIFIWEIVIDRLKAMINQLSIFKKLVILKKMKLLLITI